LLGSLTLSRREFGPHNSFKLKSSTAAKRSTNSCGKKNNQILFLLNHFTAEQNGPGSLALKYSSIFIVSIPSGKYVQHWDSY
jgi:hypothetical protein